jgi:hypothetical protein
MVDLACQLLAVLLLICIVWHAVSCVKIVARRRVRLPSSVLFFDGKFSSSLVDLSQQRRQRHLQTVLFQYERNHEVLANR